MPTGDDHIASEPEARIEVPFQAGVETLYPHPGGRALQPRNAPGFALRLQERDAQRLRALGSSQEKAVYDAADQGVRFAIAAGSAPSDLGKPLLATLVAATHASLSLDAQVPLETHAKTLGSRVRAGCARVSGIGNQPGHPQRTPLPGTKRGADSGTR